MFDRFTEDARKTMALARREAQRRGDDFIGVEHMFLGLLRLGGSTPSVVSEMGHDPESLYRELDRRIEPLGRSVTRGQIPFTRGAKTALEQAMEAACDAGHAIIAPEHLLLGIVSGGTESPVTDVLEILGVEPGVFRERLLTILTADNTPAEAGRTPGVPAGPTAPSSGAKIPETTAALLGLSIFCSALAFVVFFADPGAPLFWWVLGPACLLALVSASLGRAVGKNVDRQRREQRKSAATDTGHDNATEK